MLYSHKNKTQQTHQRWINVESTLIVNVHQRCFNIDIWLKMKVEPTYIYRGCFNVGKTTLIDLVDSMSMNQCCFNIEIWLKMKFELTYVFRRCFNVEKQRWNKIDRITWIQGRWLNVVSTLIVSWKWNLSQGMFIRYVLRQWENSI